MSDGPSAARAVLGDRFLAFAFAGADLLVEAAPDGRISFAAGAFRHRFSLEPEHFIGQHLTALVAPADRTQLSVALGAVAARGRIPPMVLRLNDTARTPVSLAAMLVPGAPPRLCVTVGAVPLAAVPPADGAVDRRSLTRDAEAKLRDGASAELSLVEMQGWQGACQRMSAAERRALSDGIISAVGAYAPGAVAGEIAEGRYGVLTPGQADLPALVQRLEEVLLASPAARHIRVDGTGVKLAAGQLGPAQAARVLRYAVCRFGAGGAEAARAAGVGDGLQGVLAQAEQRARGLRAIIAERRFRLMFQPVVSLAGRHVHHHEALLRPPAVPGSPPQNTQDFVTFVEAVSLSEQLDLAVAEQVRDALRTSPAASIAVNVSGLSMQSGTFCDRFLDLLDNPGGADCKGRVLAELTETAEIDDMTAAAASIERMRAAGVPMCLDDFGAGAAAFRYLNEFKIDFVKIDGLYVQRAMLGDRERGFVTAMVELAGKVGARVIAEMIETQEQADTMQALGVEFGQGWLFGHPGMLPEARL